MTVKITERGWAGHFICADMCMFRRNTLIECKMDSVVVSTVGAMRNRVKRKLDTIGAFGRYYETMVFGTKQEGAYIESDVSDERHFDSDWSICADAPEELPADVDNRANAMHEAVVAEFVFKFEGSK